MRILTSNILCFCFLLINISCSPGGQLDRSPNKIAIKGAFIIPMDYERVIPGKIVLIKDGKIEGIQDEGEKIPAGYNIVDAMGKYIIPGLADMHIHLRNTKEFNSYLRFGVTSVLHMSGPISSAPDLGDYRDSILTGKLVAPGLFFTSKNVEGGQMNYPGVSVSITSKADLDQFLTQAASQKVDFIKMYETIDSSLYFKLILQARDSGIYVIGHTPRNIDPMRVLESGQIMIAHGEEFFFDFFQCRDCGASKKPDDTKIAALIQVLKSKGVYVTPNLAFVYATKLALENVDEIWKDPEVKYLPPNVFQTWQSSDPNRRSNLKEFREREAVKYVFLQKLTRLLYEAGIPLLTGTDASLIGLPPGKSLIQDILELRKAGIDNFGCLLAATKTPGDFINKYAATGKNEKFGQIKTGYMADLLILEKNPLEDLQHLFLVSGIVVRGKYISREELDRNRTVFL